MARARPRRPTPPEPTAAADTSREQPDPTQQARQSEAFARLRRDTDLLAAMFNTPSMTPPLQNISIDSERAIDPAIRAAILGPPPPQDVADMTPEQIEELIRTVRPTYMQTVMTGRTSSARPNAELIEEVVRHRQGARAHRFHMPDTHRIMLEHGSSMHSVEISVTAQLLLGNIRRPTGGERYPLIDSTANAIDLVRLYGPQAAKLFKGCLEVNGVAHLQVYNAYQFVLWRGHAFFWKEIMPQVVRNLHDIWIDNYADAIPEIVMRGHIEDQNDRYDPLALIKEPDAPDRELRRFDLPSGS